MLKIFTMNSNPKSAAVWERKMISISAEAESNGVALLNNGERLIIPYSNAEFLDCIERSSRMEKHNGNDWLWSVSYEYLKLEILYDLISSAGDVKVGTRSTDGRALKNIGDKADTLGFNCCLVKSAILDRHQVKKAYAGEYLSPWRAWSKMLLLRGESIEVVRIGGTKKV